MISQILLIIIFILLIIFLVMKYTNFGNRILKTLFSDKIPNRTNEEIDELIEKSRQRSSWSKPKNIDEVNSGNINNENINNRNECSIYTFNSNIFPTFDKNILDNLTAVKVDKENQCIDETQIAAKRQERTCIGDGDTGNICINDKGKIFLPGEKEIIYVPCKVPKCKETLALFSIGFKPKSDNLCIKAEKVKNNNKEIIAILERCNISDVSQIFKIDRINPLKDGETIENKTENKDGSYVKIKHRETGKCLVPIKNNFGKFDIVFSDCSPNDGYIWLLIPPINFKNDTIPQQILFSPTTNKIVNSNNIEDFVKKKRLSIAREFFVSLTLKDMALTFDKDRVTQLIDYELFDVILNQENGSNGINIPFYNIS